MKPEKEERLRKVEADRFYLIRILKDLGGLPIPVDLEAELGVFVEIVKRFKRMREMREIKIVGVTENE